MKSLVAFYSWTGNTKKVAESIAKTLKSDIEEIQDVKQRKGTMGYIRSGFESFFKTLPAIKETKHKPEDYDLVIIGTPVWAMTIASPVRSYLIKNKTKFKKIAVLVTAGDNKFDKPAKAVEDIVKKKPEAVLGLIEDEVKGNKFDGKIKKFIEEVKH